MSFYLILLLIYIPNGKGSRVDRFPILQLFRSEIIRSITGVLVDYKSRLESIDGWNPIPIDIPACWTIIQKSDASSWLLPLVSIRWISVTSEVANPSVLSVTRKVVWHSHVMVLSIYCTYAWAMPRFYNCVAFRLPSLHYQLSEPWSSNEMTLYLIARYQAIYIRVSRSFIRKLGILIEYSDNSEQIT